MSNINFADWSFWTEFDEICIYAIREGISSDGICGVIPFAWHNDYEEVVQELQELNPDYRVFSTDRAIWFTDKNNVS